MMKQRNSSREKRKLRVFYVSIKINILHTALLQCYYSVITVLLHRNKAAGQTTTIIIINVYIIESVFNLIISGLFTEHTVCGGVGVVINCLQYRLISE